MGGRKGVRLLLALAGLALTALVASGSVGADSLPTGERTFHNNGLEPVYNAANAGEIGYFMEPNGKMHASPKAWAPIYVVVYPRDSTVAQSTTLSCIHVAMGNDNCPSHGNAIAGLAMATEPGVYTTGTGGDNVAGHDHLFDFPGGDDFNIAWTPTVVLFKSKADANEHVLTDARIEQLKEEGKVDVIPVPPLTFLCAVVPQRIWDMATPVQNG
ncbi:MAG: hypothetical protein ACM3QU_01455 [Verrucomicrobiota bacterium]